MIIRIILLNYYLSGSEAKILRVDKIASESNFCWTWWLLWFDSEFARFFIVVISVFELIFFSFWDSSFFLIIFFFKDFLMLLCNFGGREISPKTPFPLIQNFNQKLKGIIINFLLLGSELFFKAIIFFKLLFIFLQFIYIFKLNLPRAFFISLLFPHHLIPKFPLSIPGPPPSFPRFFPWNTREIPKFTHRLLAFSPIIVKKMRDFFISSKNSLNFLEKFNSSLIIQEKILQRAQKEPRMSLVSQPEKKSFLLFELKKGLF